jgi:DNA recombination protein RmuC
MSAEAVLLIALICLLGGFAAGAVTASRVLDLRAGPQTARLQAERDLLSERVIDLERATEQDREVVATLAPLAGALARVEEQVRTLERDRTQQFARLDTQLSAAHADAADLRRQTASLVGALHSPSARGVWGEVQLRRVVEHAGMLARVDFTEQATAQAPDGRTVRPDMVVHLPGGKQVVVDAKAPLAAFLSSQEADAAPSAAAALAHAKALRAHVDTLADKEYWAAFDPAPQLVICFVPGESFLVTACTADPSLLEHAMGRRVVLATPTTLLTLLRTVALTWQTEALTGNARELFVVGRQLYTRLGTLSGHTGRMGRSLHRAVEDYNALVGTLERRVLVTARRMQDLQLTDEDLPAPQGLEQVPRPLSAPELTDQELTTAEATGPEALTVGDREPREAGRTAGPPGP